MVVGVFLGPQLVELVLGEDRDLELRRDRHRAGIGLQPPGDQLGEGRLAVAVGAEQRDAVVVVDAEGQLLQHRLARLVADRAASSATIGGATVFSGSGKRNGLTVSSIIAAIGFSLSSAFRRDCAWRAFDAL